ncbi:hypothetical protein PLICRDRAFT_35611 [Plicaturopsis crispa FD-325 SS-3]|nr:hypothetical protein PLICRDRAFT_35611 [Plicaturopsis crispa FD-325 SS-3]
MSASTMTASMSLSISVAHAIAFLTRPLILSYSATTIIKLQLVLEANLVALFANSWVLNEPTRGSGRRCLTLSPSCLPPRAIYAACLAAGVQWFDWVALLGNREFDLFVDPGSVAVRYGKKNSGAQLTSIWSSAPAPAASSAKASAAIAELREATIQRKLKAQTEARAALKAQESKTLAQQMIEEDKQEDDEIFAMIADEVSAPTYMTPTFDQMPTFARSDSPASVTSGHSRTSSASDNNFSMYSFASEGESMTSISSFASSPASSTKPLEAAEEPKLSRRERARQARVFVDTSKNVVTPYDGGKTTVLTGGVMLGAKAKPAAPKPVAPKAPAARFAPVASATSWRFRA